jgi:hypothetical protein
VAGRSPRVIGNEMRPAADAAEQVCELVLAIGLATMTLRDDSARQPGANRESHSTEKGSNDIVATGPA